MPERPQKAQRVLGLQQKLHRIEEWKLADLQRQQSDLERQQRDLIAALNDADALQDLFLDARARRLRRLADELAEVSRALEEQAARVLEQGTRATLAAKLSDRVGKAFSQAVEREALLDVIDGHVAGGVQASRKIVAR